VCQRDISDFGSFLKKSEFKNIDLISERCLEIRITTEKMFLSKRKDERLDKRQ
jgi:hypothetical protein